MTSMPFVSCANFDIGLDRLFSHVCVQEGMDYYQQASEFLLFGGREKESRATFTRL